MSARWYVLCAICHGTGDNAAWERLRGWEWLPREDACPVCSGTGLVPWVPELADAAGMRQ